jgi:tetratricopeptide (TPR) repeat protein
MGVVYRAEQKSLRRTVALKMIRGSERASLALQARFHLEAEALASLQHPNIVQIYDVGEHNDCPFMAMEFVDGGTLGTFLNGKPQPARAAAKFIETLARAMHAAHQRGIVHRDLKPANILLQKPAKEEKDQSSGLADSKEPLVDPCSSLADFLPKITDFGLAKRWTEAQGQTQTGAIVGTPSYMAPEQAGGRQHEIGPPTDVYALGVILYEMLTGRPPFQDETTLITLRRVETEEPAAPSRLARQVPHDLDVICLKCLEKAPSRRFATALDLADDLHRFLDGAPILARPVGTAERIWKWVKRRPAWAALIGVSLVAVLAFGVVASWWTLQVRAERDRARHSLQVARRAIDDLYAKMAAERLLDEPQLDPLCQELLEKAQTLYGELAREHSDNPEVRRDIALAWFRLGEIHRRRDQHDQAVHAYGEAIARQEELCRAFPQEPGYLQDLANSHNWLGEVLQEHGRSLAEAERHYRAALGLQQELTRAAPSQPSYRMELARSHYNLGIVQRNTNRLPEAQADYDRAVEVLNELYRADAAEPNVRQDLARALINRGVLHRQAGRSEPAGRDYDRAIDLLARLREEFPGRAAYRFELAIARQDRGNLFWSQNQPQAAQHEHQEALALLGRLVTDFTERPSYKKKMGIVLKNLGTALASKGDKPGAEQRWNQARTLFEWLAQDSPDRADYHGLLGMTLGNLGWLRTDEKNWQQARRLIEEGIRQMQAALESNSQHPDYRFELRSQYQDLAETLVQLGDHAAAVRAASGLARVYPDRAQDGYYAACFVARCVPLAKEDKAARRYVEQAVALLREAAGKATPNLRRLPDEGQVFKPLESHPEYGLVRRDLEAKMRSGKAAP